MKIQSFVKGRLTRLYLKDRLAMFRLISRIGKRADAQYVKIFSEKGYSAFKSLLFDKNGNRITKSKKSPMNVLKSKKKKEEAK